MILLGGLGAFFLRSLGDGGSGSGGGFGGLVVGGWMGRVAVREILLLLLSFLTGVVVCVFFIVFFIVFSASMRERAFRERWEENKILMRERGGGRGVISC